MEEGQTLEVKLVEVGRFDVGAGMAKLDGYLICVAGAAKLVGKKVNVRIARVLDGTAYALLADAAPAATSPPITAEAQAEKPTRASRAKKPEPRPSPRPSPRRRERSSPRKKKSEEEPAAETPPKPTTRRGSRGGRGRKKKPAVTAEATPKCRTTPAEAPEPAAEVSDTTEAAPPKKKTRRGSRGGRGRKKPAVAAAETNGAGEAEPETDAEPRRPTIHVPQAEAPSTNGDEPGAAPARKRTRRGSRGGRRHRKPATAAADQQSSDES